MSNIQTFLENILSARYGKDVRQSIHDAIEEVDRVADTAQGSATEAAAQAEQYRNETEQLRNEVAEIVPEGYADLVEQVQENTVKVDTIIEKADLGIKETASGEEIHVNDSSNLKLREFALYGKARQNTTSGNQLLPTTIEELSVGGIVTKNNGDGSFSIIGTAQFAYGIYIIGNSFVGLNPVFSLSKGTYYVSGLPGNSELFFYKVGETASSIKTKNGVFVLEEDLECISVSLRWIENATFNSPITKIMLNKGTTALPWEEFSSGMASPNPQYPQPIEVSGESGSVEVTSTGNNLFNGSLLNGYAIDINFNLTATDGIYKTLKVFLKKGTYTISFEKSVQIVLQIIDGEYVNQNFHNISSHTVTLEKDGYYGVSFRDATSSTTVWDDTTKIQVEKGTIVTPYVEYQEPTTATIPTPNGLAGIKVSSGGNYTDQNGQQWICDEIVKYADGSGKKIERIKHYSLAVADMNNSEDYPGWINVTDLQEVVGNGVNTVKNNDCILNVGRDVGINTNGTTSTIYLRKPTYLMTQSQWKENYPDLVVEIYLPRITPIHTPLTAEEIAEIEKLHTFYPITNISNDFDCGMKVTYNADSKNYIDKQLAEKERAREQAMMSMFLLLPEETQAAMIENDVNNLLAESEN